MSSGEENLQPHWKRGFTILEILLVIGILGVLISIVILAINPRKSLISTKDAVRGSMVKTMQNALYQYLIDTGSYPNSNLIPSNGTGTAIPICTQGVTGDATCVNFDALTPAYLTAIPRDTSETTANYTGYKVYTSVGRAMVYSTKLGSQ